MSIDYSLYVGPHLRCKNPLVQKQTTVRGCLNPSCSKHKQQIWDKNIRFCAICGSVVDDSPVTTTGHTVGVGDLIEAVSEKMVCVNREYPWWPDVDVWIGNLTTGPGQWLDPKSESKYFDLTDLSGLSGINRKEQMDEFAKFYEDAIAKITEAYGPSNVELCWGFFNWAS